MRVGRDIFLDLSRRWMSRSPVERGIVTNFVTQEAVFDHIFSNLGVDTETVNHPVVLTEPLCCPGASREGVSELLFELYGAPSVAYGVDALFSRYRNQRATVGSTGLVVASGHHSSTIIPIVGGKIDAVHASRLELGGADMHQYMMSLLHRKFPLLAGEASYYRAKELVEHHTYVPLNYMEQLRELEVAGYLKSSTHCIQLPTAHLFADLELKKQRKDEQVRKLKDMHSKKQEASLASSEAKLAELKLLQASLVANKAGSKRAMRSAGFRGADSLAAEIGKLDTELYAKKQAEQTAANAAASKAAKEKARPRTAEELKREADPEKWLVDARAEVEALGKKQVAFKKRGEQVTDRKSRESKKRMRLLVRTALSHRPLVHARGPGWGCYAPNPPVKGARGTLQPSVFSRVGSKLPHIYADVHAIRLQYV